MSCLEYLHSLTDEQVIAWQRGVTAIWFESGSHGLELCGTEVKSVTTQARLLRVKPGWRVLSINGMECKYPSNVKEQLRSVSKGNRPYPVVFASDAGLIRIADAHALAKRKALDKMKLYVTDKQKDAAESLPSSPRRGSVVTKSQEERL